MISAHLPDAEASSAQETGSGPLNAIDGNMSTKWVSSGMDSEWIMVDFNQRITYNRVVLQWADEYASGYEIQGSLDGIAWVSLVSAGNLDGGEDSFYLDEQNHRYVRVACITGNSTFYSLKEFEVFNDKPSAYASSSASLDNGPEKAIDSNVQTMWSSKERDDEWIVIDWKKQVTFNRIVLEWASGYAEEYEIQAAQTTG